MNSYAGDEGRGNDAARGSHRHDLLATPAHNGKVLREVRGNDADVAVVFVIAAPGIAGSPSAASRVSSLS